MRPRHAHYFATSEIAVFQSQESVRLEFQYAAGKDVHHLSVDEASVLAADLLQTASSVLERLHRDSDVSPLTDEDLGEEAHRAELVASADRIRAAVDWSKLPKLAVFLQSRPSSHAWWLELVALVVSAISHPSQPLVPLKLKTPELQVSLVLDALLDLPDAQRLEVLNAAYATLVSGAVGPGSPETPAAINFGSGSGGLAGGLSAPIGLASISPPEHGEGLGAQTGHRAEQPVSWDDETQCGIGPEKTEVPE